MAPLIALDESGSQLLMLDSAAPGTITSTVPVQGLGTGEMLQGIDFRPATAGLYGIGVNGTAARILLLNPANGQITQVGQGFTVSAGASFFGFDFNPLLDRIRVVDDALDNLSINPDTGAVTTQTALDSQNIAAAAYTNNFFGTTSTVLYVLNHLTDNLNIIDPPSSGKVTAVGPLGVDFLAVNGFDIAADNTAFAALNGNLFQIALNNGTATLVGQIGPTVTTFRGLAIQPAGVFNYSAAFFSAPEGSNATITVNRLGGSTGAVSVQFATSNGTAIAGIDYQAVSGVLNFAAGQTQQTFIVPVFSDTLFNATRTVNLTLSVPTGGAVVGSQSTAVLSITNTTPPPVPPVMNVTSSVMVRFSPLRFNFRGKTVRTRAMLKNVTISSIGGPISLVLTNLPSRVQLVNATGVTQVQAPVGSPYVTVNVSSLGPQQRLIIPLLFANKTRRRFNAVPVVLAGQGPR